MPQFIQKLARKCVDYQCKHKYRNFENTISFSKLSKDYNTCLICMPSKLDLIKPASEILPRIAEIFSDRNIKILVTSSIDPQSHEIIKKFIVVKPSSNDIDRFSFPRKNFIKRISEGGLAVSIDMDIYPNYFNALLGLKAEAKIRTTFDKGIGLPYYNFILGVQSIEAAPKVSYRAMADILENFKI